MKNIILISMLVMTLVLTNEVNIHEIFYKWQIENNKFYLSNGDEELRMQIFKDNYYKVQQMNIAKIGGDDVVFDMTQFADMTEYEFQYKILMPSNAAPKFESERQLPLKLSDTPSSFDWREHGAVTDVQDQGASGTCWAFSTTANIAGVNYLKTGNLMDLSVEQLVDCDGTFEESSKHADCGVFGGWPYLAYQYIMREGGIDPEEAYPYCSGGLKHVTPCYPCPAPGFNETLCGPPVIYCDAVKYPCRSERSIDAIKVVDWASISTDEVEIAAQLVNVGPLSVGLDASGIQFYRSGVFDPWFCDAGSLNHAVLMVGYGQSALKKDYWTIKNSWGSKWGESGYFRIKRGSGTCGINTLVATAIL